MPLGDFATTTSPAELLGFRRVQTLAYDCAEAVAAQLRVGITERETAALMKRWLVDHGVDECFHEPFAWFGDRTAFRGAIANRLLGGFNPAFYPGSRKLEANMPFVLDCAPTQGGYTADIGYCGVLGHNAVLDKLMDDLREYRALILDQVRRRRTLAEVSRAVDALCARHGYEPRHKAYPFQVLAHRVEKIDTAASPLARSVFNFGLRHLRELASTAAQARKQGWSPLWNSGEASDHAPMPGLWAVEPHIGFRDVGAKFEELLVITDTDAYWLDDDVPHVRRWRQRGIADWAL